MDTHKLLSQYRTRTTGNFTDYILTDHNVRYHINQVGHTNKSFFIGISHKKFEKWLFFKATNEMSLEEALLFVELDRILNKKAYDSRHQDYHRLLLLLTVVFLSN